MLFLGGGAPKLLIAINNCLDEIGEFKERDKTVVACRKRSSKVVKYFLRGDVEASSLSMHYFDRFLS